MRDVNLFHTVTLKSTTSDSHQFPLIYLCLYTLMCRLSWVSPGITSSPLYCRLLESFHLSCMTSFLPPQAAPNPTRMVWSCLTSLSVCVKSRHIYSNTWPLFVSRTERSTLTAFLTPTPSSWCSASCPTRPPRPSTSGRCRAKITSQRPASLWTVSFSLCSHRVCCESNVMVVCEGSSCASLCLFIKKSLSGV